MIGSADIHKGVQTTWNNFVHSSFEAHWGGDLDHESLHDQEGEQGFFGPFCVYELKPGNITDRMTAAVSAGRREIRDVPLEFRVHTKQTTGSPKSAKQIAADLAAIVMQIFGGHPTIEPKPITLDNGSVLIAQYQDDFGMKTGETEHSWHVNYILRIDLPVAA